MKLSRSSKAPGVVRSGRSITSLRWVIAGLALALPLAAPAQSAGSGSSRPESALQVPQRDPWVPAEVRAAAKAAPPAPRASGAALRVQVEARLRARFEAADPGRSGRLNADLARAGGLGWLAEHFDQVDTRRQGSVSFEDVQRYLRERDRSR